MLIDCVVSSIAPPVALTCAVAANDICFADSTRVDAAIVDPAVWSQVPEHALTPQEKYCARCYRGDASIRNVAIERDDFSKQQVPDVEDKLGQCLTCYQQPVDFVSVAVRVGECESAYEGESANGAEVHNTEVPILDHLQERVLCLP